MALEIERRFLIKNDQWKEFVTHKNFIEQGYLSYNLKDWIVRIRFNGKNFKIALKKHIKNFTNYEYEYLIPTSEGEQIMATLTNTIKKEIKLWKDGSKCMTIKESDYCEINKVTKPCRMIKFDKSISYYIKLIKKLDWKGDLSLRNTQIN